MKTRYIKKRGAGWVVLNKSGRVISRHKTKRAAEASFRAMMRSLELDRAQKRRKR